MRPADKRDSRGGMGGMDRDKGKTGQNQGNAGNWAPPNNFGNNMNRSNPEDYNRNKNDRQGGDKSILGKRNPRDDYSSAPSAAKVFVGGLDYGLTEDEFRKHFESKFGPVKAAQIVKDANTGQSKGFGFVTFQSEAIAKKLITEIRVTTINGRKVDLRTADPKDSKNQKPTIQPLNSGPRSDR
jgi:RNA recognition motif-containing protein